MKIMAIDYGDAHTGIAISDFTCTLAGYTTVINSRKAEVVVQEIGKIIAEHGVSELVLGYPKNMDGTVGPVPRRPPPSPRYCGRPPASP